MDDNRTSRQRNFDRMMAVLVLILAVWVIKEGWEISYERAVKTHPGHIVSGAGN